MQSSSTHAHADPHAGGDESQRLSRFFGGSKRKEIAACTSKCMPGCVRGGAGAAHSLAVSVALTGVYTTCNAFG